MNSKKKAAQSGRENQQVDIYREGDKKPSATVRYPVRKHKHNLSQEKLCSVLRVRDVVLSVICSMALSLTALALAIKLWL